MRPWDHRLSQSRPHLRSVSALAEPECRTDRYSRWPGPSQTAHRDPETNAICSVSFLNVPSFVLSSNAQIAVPGLTTKAALRLSVRRGVLCLRRRWLSQSRTRAKQSRSDPRCRQADQSGGDGASHSFATQTLAEGGLPPEDSGLDFLYGVIFVGGAKNPANHSRNVCVFAEGEVDRSPTGTGVSGRAAIEVESRARQDRKRSACHADREHLWAPLFSVRAHSSATVGVGAQEVLSNRPLRFKGRAWITGIKRVRRGSLRPPETGFPTPLIIICSSVRRLLIRRLAVQDQSTCTRRSDHRPTAMRAYCALRSAIK